jgi:YbbR domain-containing protein
MLQPDKTYNHPGSKGGLPTPTRHMKRRDNLIFLLCLIIAASFWLLVKLSDYYAVSYNLKVKYINVPEEKRLTKIIDTTLTVNFTAKGYEILKLRLFVNPKQVTIDLNDVEMNKLDNDVYYINTNYLKDKLTGYIDVNESTIIISKRSLRFELKDQMEKMVPVRLKEEIAFKSQFGLYDKERIEPQKVMVYAPQSVLDTLNYIYTEVIRLVDVDKDQIVSARLFNPLPDLINLDPENVTVKLRVERFTESTLELDVDVSTLHKKIRTFPSKITVHFRVAQKDFSNIQASQFKVVPETRNINLNEVKRLHLKLVEKPDFIRDEWISPADVEFLIIKE